jgi:hypothetical protein
MRPVPQPSSTFVEAMFVSPRVLRERAPLAPLIQLPHRALSATKFTMFTSVLNKPGIV